MDDPRLYKVLGMANLKYLIFSNKLRFNSPFLKLVYQKGDFAIWENSACLPRTYIVHNAKIIRGPKENVAKSVFRDNFNPKTTVILERDSPIEMNLPDTSQDIDEKAEFLKYSNNSVIIRAVLKNDGFLVLSDVNYPGWKVDVLDVQASTHMRMEPLFANSVFRAVPLRKGEYLVSFTFRPAFFYLGAAISILTVIFVLAGVFRLNRKSQFRHHHFQ
jgi:hypothetical protein